MKHKTKLRIRSWVLITLIVIGLIGVMYSAIEIILWCNNVERNNEISKEIKEYVVEEINYENLGTVVNTNYKIDFSEVKKRNKDTVAYLAINGLDISNFVVRSKDNSYYLNHNFDKEYSTAGWIFADYHNKMDGSDKNIIIYGHNTKNGSMFGTLKNILTSEWYDNENNLIVTLITEKGEYKYQVFSVYSIKPEDYYINTEFSNKEYQIFLSIISKRSIKDFKVDLSDTKQLLTLSSCLKEGKERVVLHAKLLN